MATHEYSVKTQGNTKISKHFRVLEFACKDGTDSVIISSELVWTLEKIREHFNRPVIINSAYRTPTHNKAVGGSPSSRHLLGQAADIVVKDVPPSTVYAFCSSLLTTGGVGKYDTFTHVDVRKKNHAGITQKEVNFPGIFARNTRFFLQLFPDYGIISVGKPA